MVITRNPRTGQITYLTGDIIKYEVLEKALKASSISPMAVVMGTAGEAKYLSIPYNEESNFLFHVNEVDEQRVLATDLLIGDFQ